MPWHSFARISLFGEQAECREWLSDGMGSQNRCGQLVYGELSVKEGFKRGLVS